MAGTIAASRDDLPLVARARVEPAAFAALYDRYFTRVYNYIRYRIGDAQTTDDLTGQVFERVLANLGHYCPDRAPFAAWLFAIARNTVYDHLRAQKRHRWLSLDALRDRCSADPEQQHVLEREEVHGELLNAVSRLGERERNLIAFKFGAGLTNRRIAELTGLSPSNVGVILYRAVRRLRVELNVQEKDRG